MGKACWLAGGGHVYPLPKFYFIEDQEFYICLPDKDFCEQMAGFVREWEGPSLLPGGREGEEM